MRRAIHDLVIITNPRSGKSQTPAVMREAHRQLWGRRLCFKSPENFEALDRLVKDLDPATTDAIIVMGGDGTFHQVLRRLPSFPNSIPVMPFPSGTANDFANELGIRPDWLQVQQLLDSRSIDTVDVVTVNGLPFVTTAGIGLGHELIQVFNATRSRSNLMKTAHKLLGQGIYSGLAASTILGRQNFARKIRVRSNHFDEQLTAAAVFICNQSSLAGSLMVAPKIENDDDRFNVLIIPHSSRLNLIYQMSQMKRQQLPEEFYAFSARELEIRSLDGKPLGVFGDGEQMTEDKNLNFTIQSGGLRVLRPHAGKRQLGLASDLELHNFLKSETIA